MEQGKINLVLMNISVDGGFSGVTRYFEMIMEGLKERKEYIVHTVILFEKKSMLFPDIRRDGESVHALIPFPLNPRPIIKDDCWMTFYSNVVADILNPYFMGMENIIWNLHCINLARLAVVFQKACGGQILSYLHCIPWKLGMESNTPDFWKRYRDFLNGSYEDLSLNAIEWLTYEAADKVVCVTQSGKKYLTDVMKVPPDKISVVYNGLKHFPISDLPKVEREVGELLYVGRISNEKGVPYLLNALRKVKRSGYTCRLTLAGVGRPALVERLKKEYSDLDLNFLGQVNLEELVQWYSKCSIGIIPSLHEQCSYVALEMAMYGVPLIVADIDGLSEMFTHGETALKVPLEFNEKRGLGVSTDKLASAIIRLLKKPKLREQLSSNVYQHFLQHFTMEKMIDNSVTVYKQLECQK